MQTTRISPRPLTNAEENRVRASRAHISQVDQIRSRELRQAWAAHDELLLEIVEAGGSQTALAKLLNVERQSVYLAIRRARERRDR